MDIFVLLICALVIDIVMGEPPASIHPVVWVGYLITRWEMAIRFLARKNPRYEKHCLFIGGITMAFLLPLFLSLGIWGVLMGLSSLTFIWAQFLENMLSLFLLKATFSIKALLSASSCVKKHLWKSDIIKASQALKKLCSRKATSQQEVIDGTICSLAENTSDSVIAPLMMLLLFGIPGACFYRCVNTMDAMVGYHKAPFRWLGWGVARLDDFLNMLPARLTALFFLLIGGIFRLSLRQGFKVMMHDAHKTPSPNGGWPMATMAGLLGIRLSKKASYLLGSALPSAKIEKIEEAQKLVAMTIFLAIVCFFLLGISLS